MNKKKVDSSRIVTRLIHLKDKKDKAFLPGEDLPAAAPPEVHPLAGKDMIEDAAEGIRLDGNYISLVPLEISASELVEFKRYANDLACDPDCEDYMPGIRIIYGLDGSSLVLYYQPMRFCADGPKRMGAKGWTRHYNLCKEGGFYKYDGGFTELNSGELTIMNTQTENYRRLPADGHPYGVEVKNEDGDFEGFIDDGEDSYAGSARAMVFPVQQLIDLAGGGVVKLWNMWGRTGVETGGVTVYYRKHEILLSTENVTVSGTNVHVPAGGKFSDLSHICPPSCNGNRFMFYVNP